MRLTLVVHLRALHSDSEDRVRARRVLIHVRGTDMPINIALSEDFHHVGGRLDDKCRQVLDVDTRVLVTKLQLRTLLVEQVTNFFVVDFQVAHTRQKLLLGVRLDLLEDVLEGARHDAFVRWIIRDTSDRESLSCSCLSICKNRAVVALDDILTDRVGRLSEDLFLGRAIDKKHQKLALILVFILITYFQS